MTTIATTEFEKRTRLMKTNGPKSLYFLMGNDHFLQRFFIEEVASVIFGNDKVEKQILIPDEMSGRQILEELNTSDLFMSRKLFILRNPITLHKKYKDELLEYCRKPIETHCLIIVMDEWGNHHPFIKALIKITQPVSCSTPFSTELSLWIRKIFKQNGIDPVSDKIVQSLLDMGGDSLNHLNNEIEKICLSLETAADLTLEFVEQFGGWKRDYREFELFKALGKKDLLLSLKLGRALLTRDSTILALLYPLTEFFQELLFLKIQPGTKKSQYSYTRLSRLVNNNLSDYAKQYSKRDIKLALGRLEHLDQQIKSSRINDVSAITDFIFATLGNG